MTTPQLNLLLVDDQAENLLALEAVLGDLGHRLVKAGSGREALRRLLEEDFALILLDIQMPEMDGFETAQLIRGRERSQATPIIFLTATMRTDEMVFKGYASGAVDYLIKPIVPEILRAKIQVFAELAAARKKLEIEIAERQRAQHERERFFSLSRDLLCIAGFDGYFKRLNPAWEKTFGYTEDELLDKPFLEFVHPDDREATQIETRKLAAGEEVTAFENRYRCKDGSYKWLLWSATSLVERELIYAGARDYTERKEAAEKILKLNQELRRHASQLEAANQELEAFSFTISHDLRAPLRYVNGFLGLLQKGLADKLDEKSSRLMQVITQSTATMDQLILALLEFSRMSRAPLQTQRVPLAPLVREVCEVLEPMRPRSEIVWKISELPEVEADPLLLRLVWQNLLSNALKYSRHRSPAVIEIGSHVGPGRDLREDQEARATGLGGRALLPGDTASLAARAGDTAARDPAPGASANAFVFFVHDNGVGFDMEYVGRLFGVFQRLHPKDQYEGIGVGLATVRRIIARHGGGVWAEGKVGEGATFYFSLPRKAGES